VRNNDIPESKYDANEIALENSEWIEALDYIRIHQGDERSREMLRLLQDNLLKHGVSLAEATLNTPYRNTINPQQQPGYPGNIELEQKIENIINGLSLIDNPFIKVLDTFITPQLPKDAAQGATGFRVVLQGFNPNNTLSLVLRETHLYKTKYPFYCTLPDFNFKN
jgi:hypothetical protein